MTAEKYTIELRGCAPVPLAHYLKALGILRLVSEQVDQTAQGWWEDDSFVLCSTLDGNGAAEFFLKKYRPTPLVAPWNGGSGFFTKDNKKAIESIHTGSARRFGPYRELISLCHQLLAEMNLDKKPKETEKPRLLQFCRNRFPDESLEWLDAAYLLLTDGPKYPPLLGTGGNDGRLEFTNNYMQRLTEIFDVETGLPQSGAKLALEESLFSSVANERVKSPIGQFDPGSAGGANAQAGYDADAAINRWDFILLFEGAIAFAAASIKKLEQAAAGTLAYPFCVRAAGVGYASADASDESDSRAEMWMPIWRRPASFKTVSALLSEGRVETNRRAARNGVDFARAVASLGVDRGIDQFQRFGFHQRNGLAYFAVPLGRFEVHSPPGVDELLAEIDQWLDRFRRAAVGKTAPARAGRALRRLESSILGLCQHGRTDDVQAVLVALGEAEATVAISTKLREDAYLSPVPLLSPQWISESYDGSAEFRLAAALASIFHTKVGPFRRHLEPIDWKSPFSKWAEESGDPNIVWGGGGLERNLLAVIKRRTVEVLKSGKQENDGDLFFPCRGRCSASLGDITAFINRDLNGDRIVALLRGLILINWRSIPWDVLNQLRGRDTPTPDAAYALLKLCHLSMPLPLPHGSGERAIPLTPAITHRAAAGDVTTATRLAAGRLRGCGFTPAVELIPCRGERARRTAAALLFPLWHSSKAKNESPVERLRDIVLRRTEPPDDDDENEQALASAETS